MVLEIRYIFKKRWILQELISREELCDRDFFGTPFSKALLMWRLPFITYLSSIFPNLPAIFKRVTCNHPHENLQMPAVWVFADHRRRIVGMPPLQFPPHGEKN
jgi:hypothetical protein